MGFPKVRVWGLLNELFPEQVPADIPLIGVQCEGILLNNLAEVTIKQRYKNTSTNPIQAIYVFPIDDEAAVNGFTAHLGERRVRGVIKEREEARQEYNSAIAQGHGAALLETAGSGALKVQLGNLEPGCEAEICIVYSTLCSVEENAIVLRIPTTIKERYMPQSAYKEPEVVKSQPTYQSKVGYGLSLEMDVFTSGDIVSVSSSTHPLNVRNDPEDRRHCVAKLGVEKIAMDGDVIVRVEHADIHKPAVVLSSQADYDQGSAGVMLSFIPEFEESAAIPAENMEFVFLVDRSGSMRGSPISQCRDALQLFLRSLPEGCWFNIVGFGSSFEKLFEESRVYDSSSLSAASGHVSSIDANLGGTEILKPLQNILSDTKTKSRHRKVFLLTDGSVGNTAQVIQTVRENAGNTRVFTFGVGQGAAMDLVRGVARAGRGEASFIREGEPVDEKVINQLSKAMEPCLEDIEINWGVLNVKEQSPPKADFSPVFNKQPYTVFALLSKDSQHQSVVVLGGKMNGKTVRFPVNVTPWTTTRTDCRILHSLAVKNVIRNMEETTGAPESNKKSILAMSLRYEVASSQASFLAIEEREEVKDGVLVTVRVPLSAICGGQLPQIMPLYSHLRAAGCRGGSRARSSAPMSARSLGFVAHSSSGAAMGGGFVEVGHLPPPPSSLRKCKRMPTASQAVSKTGSARSAMLPQSPASTQDNLMDLTGPVPLASLSSMQPGSATPSLAPAGDTLQALAALQSVNGSWQLNDQLAGAVQLSKSVITSAQPSIASPVESAVWATAIAVACLEVKCSERRAAFALLAKKAKKWMEGHLGKGAGMSVEELIKTAKGLF